MSEDTQTAPAPDAPEQPQAPEPTPHEVEQAKLQEAIEIMAKDSEPDEPAPEPEPEEPGEGPDDLLAAVAAERQGIRSQMEQMKARETEMDAKMQEVNAILQTVKEDPVSFMNQHGSDDWYMQATKRFLNKGEETPEQMAQRREEVIKNLAEKVQSLEQRIEQQPFEHQAQTYLRDLTSKLSAPEYKIVSEDPTAVRELHLLVKGYADEHQRFLPIEDALGKVKQAQIERLQRLTQLDDWQAISGNGQSTEPAQQATSASPAGTIPSAMPARGAPPQYQEDDVFDEEARIQRAIKAMSEGNPGGP